MYYQISSIRYLIDGETLVGLFIVDIIEPLHVILSNTYSTTNA
jgi:hypothetical protein